MRIKNAKPLNSMLSCTAHVGSLVMSRCSPCAYVKSRADVPHSYQKLQEGQSHSELISPFLLAQLLR